MKLHLPLGLRRAVVLAFFSVAASSPGAHAETASVVIDNPYASFGYGNTHNKAAIYTGEDERYSLNSYTHTQKANGDGVAIELGSGDSTFNGNLGQVEGHLMVTGNIIIHSDGYASMLQNRSLNAAGQDVIIGDANTELAVIPSKIDGVSVEKPKYGGVLSFLRPGGSNVIAARTLTVGSLQTHMGAYVDDVKTFIVSPEAVEKKQETMTVTHYATSDADMDIRNNGNENGYILADIGGNVVDIKIGNFSLDTEKTSFNMDSGDTSAEGYNYDKMNTGDYGYVKKLTIGEYGTSVVKALGNDLTVVDGVTIHTENGSVLNMDGNALATSSLAGKVTNVSRFTVATFSCETLDNEGNHATRQGADALNSSNARDAAKNFVATVDSLDALVYVEKKDGTDGKMVVESNAANADGTVSYTLSNIEGSRLVAEAGNFILKEDSLDELALGSKDGETVTTASVTATQALTLGALTGYEGSTLDMDGYQLTLNGDETDFGGTLDAKVLEVNGNADFSGKVTASETTIAEGKAVTLSGVTEDEKHELGEVSGGKLELTDGADAVAKSVDVDELDLEKDTELSVEGDVNITPTTPPTGSSELAGSLTSTGGNISLTDATISGAVKATSTDDGKGNITLSGTCVVKEGADVNAADTLTMQSGASVERTEGATEPIKLTANEFVVGDAAGDSVEDSVTLSDAELDFEKTTVSAGDSLTITDCSGSIGDTSVDAGALTISGTSELSGDITATNGSSITLSGTSELTGDITASGGSSITLSDNSKVTGAVELTGETDKLTLGSGSSVTGAVTGEGSMVSSGEGSSFGEGNSGFTGNIKHESGTLTATGDNAFGSEEATVKIERSDDATRLEVELEGASVGNKWVIESDTTLISSGTEDNPEQGSSISGPISGPENGEVTISKIGEAVTLTGEDASFANGNSPQTKGHYIFHVEEGEVILDATKRDGTLSANAGTDIYVTGGTSYVGDLALTCEGNASSQTLNEKATRVHFAEAGSDMLASATGAPLSAADKDSGLCGAQLILDGWAGEPESSADGTRVQLTEGITGFDAEIYHTLETRNVSLVEETDANGRTNSYAELSINHKGASKNAYEQGVSDAITASEGADARMGELVTAMRHTGSEAEAKAALNSIGGAGIASTMAAQMSANHDHMRTLRGSIGQPQPHEGWTNSKAERPQWVFPTSLWTLATGATAELDEEGPGHAGYTRDEAGILIGGDVTLGRTALVGLAVGYSRANVDSTGHEIKGDQYYVDLYARKNIGRFTQSATLGLAMHDWTLERSVHVKTGDRYADFTGRADGKTTGMSVNFSYEAAYNFVFRKKHTLSPLFMLESALNRLDGYREGGDIGNAGLQVEFEDTWTTTLGIGARYAYEFNGFGRSEKKGSLSARALFIADVGDVKSQMSGRFITSDARFRAESAENDHTGILVGADAVIPVSRHWSVFGNASAEFRSSYTDVSAGVGVRYQF